jgi:hypothetical protein
MRVEMSLGRSLGGRYVKAPILSEFFPDSDSSLPVLELPILMIHLLSFPYPAKQPITTSLCATPMFSSLVTS